MVCTRLFRPPAHTRVQSNHLLILILALQGWLVSVKRFGLSLSTVQNLNSTFFLWLHPKITTLTALFLDRTFTYLLTYLLNNLDALTYLEPPPEV